MTDRSCAHVACTCAVDAERSFCSASCRHASGTAPDEVGGCRCGHPQCLGDAGRRGDDALAEGTFPTPPQPLE